MIVQFRNNRTDNYETVNNNAFLNENLAQMKIKIYRQPNLRAIFIFTSVYLAFSFFRLVNAQEINKLRAIQNSRLPGRVSFALDLALKKYDGEKVWLIYSIESIHSAKSNEKIAPSGKSKIPLAQLIYGKNQNMSDHFKLAIILDYSLESGHPYLYHVFIQNINQAFLNEDRPVFWLGKEAAMTSLDWLEKQFDKTSYLKLKQEIIKAADMHDCSAQVVEFQKSIILGKNPASLKNEAITILGKHNTPGSFRILAYLACKHKNIQIRKKAISALSELNNSHAFDVISFLARREKSREVRQAAIFWLSQQRNERATVVLEAILQSETDLNIKEYALFSISQLPEGKSAPILNRFVQTSPDSRIRKKALFWLDQTKDQRMFDFFLDLANKNIQNQSN